MEYLRTTSIINKTTVTACLISLLSLSCNHKPKADGSIFIDLSQKGAVISPSMYGVFFEEINHAGEGGLYAEMVKNRSFEAKEHPKGYHAEGDKLYPDAVPNHLNGVIHELDYKWSTDEIPAWSLDTSGAGKVKMKLTKENPLYTSTPNSLKLEIPKPQKASLINSGYSGMGLRKGEEYNLRFYVRDFLFSGKMSVQLISSSGKVLEDKTVDLKTSSKWNEYKMTLASDITDAKAKLVLVFDGEGTVWLDYISLFPAKTFKNRPNGLREDIVNFLIDLNPGFVRWPGGCIVEGISLANRFEWKKTLGDPAQRKGEYGMWGYRNTYGFGYHEFLQFCEDIGTYGMFVCNIGIGCQARMGDACTESEVQFYIDDVLDAIEYAIGDNSTKWGAKRAAAGHSEPFPLKYVEIGNENFGELYNKRFDLFYSAIKERYPELILISNHGLGNDVDNIDKTDMIDPHWYVAPNFFFRNADIFDNQPRGDYKVYVGEYACNKDVGGGNMMAALGEAAFITGMERNSDLVTMASYAPLFENRIDRTWPVNLIWIDNLQVVGRSSYYVQKMTTENIPDYNILTDVNTKCQEIPNLNTNGHFGLGSWSTKVAFKNFELDSENGKTEKLYIKNNIIQSGEWVVSDTMVSQKSMSNMTGLFFENKLVDNYTIKFKAQKEEGAEGFLIYLGMTNDNKDGYLFNLGGWGNTHTVLETLKNGDVDEIVSKSVPQEFESKKWYNIEIVKHGNTLKLSVDNKNIIEYSPTAIEKQFVVSGYDEAAQELIVKVVNADREPWSPSIKINNATSLIAKGKAITLASASPENENSFEEPFKIIPKEEIYNAFSKEYEYVFEPYSYTILRIKVKQKKEDI